MTWSFVEPLRDEMSVDEFEADYGFVFPEAYKEVVLQHNNGYPSRDSFNLPSGERCKMDHLYSFNREDADNMWDFNAANNLEDGFVAFATDPFGNQFGFRLADKAIVFVDYDADEIWEIADDFTAFLNQLEVSE